MKPSTHKAALAAATSNDPRWARVLARDPHADGRFFYSVKSTGVYCRPSCAARPMRPENVAFHASGAEAERAGFRPCKRCRPERLAPSPQRAATAHGEAPEEIRYAVGRCSLGALLVAHSARGLCAILLDDEPEPLLRDLQRRFPHARLAADASRHAPWLARVAGFVEHTGHSLDLPLDMRGTGFQQQVWQTLLAIPAGATASYAEVARRIGAPRAVRAVAQACAANPLAVAVPCHRVVRSDGGLSGYRWGMARKRLLLRREAQA
ncbi:hypothetical protein ASG87_06165 [Frateuria sp. Soil773]|uniref:methylated-DNA--[protein]-cysteine S-methyltransferase n=1 Tax=Frateuria sp. Soil773 TaxID=1736407 RepID=UPI000700F270|nr:methylated-DNA--[protein]-cysteine S-methyltransferase [Frateuria sp. Soil773]KRE89120.1 hypothetical protein ASG87_06165 [Frateuria sp. Soil773]